ncbi:MAG: hypothetical protein KA164_12365 [Rhodoferax sp.]|jgi:hypothetical protein|nr:hypothetical protein [Rhodoferax sp.]
MRTAAMYNETHQSRTAAPTAYESLLGDAIERAFAQDIHDLDGLVAYLNQSGPSGPNGQPWTPENYSREIARLGV